MHFICKLHLWDVATAACYRHTANLQSGNKADLAGQQNKIQHNFLNKQQSDYAETQMSYEFTS